ncbi:MAG: hypothetical protein GTO40_03910 [Deltaproteobacteria bacterium]|nr:hypothetical protein [Deltaproteobacteria bacterium]
MIDLAENVAKVVDNALANGCPCILASASKSGEPDIGFKGSMMVFDSESLAYWERTKRVHLKNITENPHVVVMIRDQNAKVALRFHGEATAHESGPVRDQVMARVVKPELDKDPERTGLAVVIRLNKVTTISGQVLQSR